MPAKSNAWRPTNSREINQLFDDIAYMGLFINDVLGDVTNCIEIALIAMESPQFWNHPQVLGGLLNDIQTRLQCADNITTDMFSSILGKDEQKNYPRNLRAHAQYKATDRVGIAAGCPVSANNSGLT
jgi:hypothetical protein